MNAFDPSLALLGVVLLVGLLIPDLLRRFHLPFATSLIIVGAILGPHGLGQVQVDQTLTLFAFLGATFHMLLAGFESQGLSTDTWQSGSTRLALVTGLVPGMAGAGLALAFGFSPMRAVFVGALSLSTSVMLTFAFVNHFETENAQLKSAIRSAAVLQELAATLLVFVVLKSFQPHERFPLFILLGLVVSSAVVLRLLVPEIATFFFDRFARRGSSGPEPRVRFTLALLLLVLFFFTGLDVEAVVGAFLVGFSLAPVKESDVLREKLRLVGYALFVPVFLFTVGMQTDLRAVLDLPRQGFFVILFVATALIFKTLGGFVGARWLGAGIKDALFTGLATLPRLAVPTSAAFAALSAGIISNDIYTAAILMTVVSSLVAPAALAILFPTADPKKEIP
jgi:Kef-type K+ transport system membrane component KefB